MLLKQKRLLILAGKIYSDARKLGCCGAEKHICFLLQKENHNALFKNSCLIFSIYIMLIRVDKNSSGLCLLLEPFPDIVDTEPFTFPSEYFS